MSSPIASGFELAKALEAEGLPLPDDCISAELHVGVEDAITVTFRCFVTPSKLEKIGKALILLSREDLQ